ncbi:hypothetical protein [Streptomyces adustus]|uniref:hypothetical protein n=1 Tax=Streptomyces adustus TaxID=1609272 RepID=UPI00371A1044
MRERPVDVDESGSGREVKSGKRIDLSVPQVAGSAVAAVVAAKLASYFGVYGTILGAGVVSVVATCGGTLFQHFFRRTGEQLREATVPSRTAAPVPAGTAAAAPSRAAVPGVPAAPPVGEFTRGTVYRARVRGWRRPVVAAALVFGVTMTGITTYELVSGSSFSGGGSTTVGGALSNHGEPSSGAGPASGTASGPSSDPSAGPSAGPGSGGASSSGSSATPDPTGGASASGGVPDGGAAGGGSTQSPVPAPSVTASRGADDGSAPAAGTPGASATPEPSASSRSGTDVQGRVGPAAR